MLLFVHGGVWSMGEKSQFAKFAFRFASEGLVVVVVQYSLFPAATVPEQVADVCSALTWTMDHIREYGGNPDRIFLAGHSSGGCECVRVLEGAVPVKAAVSRSLAAVYSWDKMCKDQFMKCAVMLLEFFILTVYAPSFVPLTLAGAHVCSNVIWRRLCSSLCQQPSHASCSSPSTSFSSPLCQPSTLLPPPPQFDNSRPFTSPFVPLHESTSSSSLSSTSFTASHDSTESSPSLNSFLHSNKRTPSLFRALSAFSRRFHPPSPQLAAVHLVDAHLCSEAHKYVAALLVSLGAMLHLELPHVNVLSKIDLIEKYGKLGE